MHISLPCSPPNTTFFFENFSDIAKSVHAKGGYMSLLEVIDAFSSQRRESISLLTGWYYNFLIGIYCITFCKIILATVVLCDGLEN